MGYVWLVYFAAMALAQLFSSRFGDLMDGMGSTMFTIPVANLTMEECNESATGMQRVAC